MQCVFNKPSVILVCCAAVFLSACNVAQNEFDTALVDSVSGDVDQLSSGDTEVLAFTESAAKAAEAGLPFPRVSPQANDQPDAFTGGSKAGGENLATLEKLDPATSESVDASPLAAQDEPASVPNADAEARLQAENPRVATLAEKTSDLSNTALADDVQKVLRFKEAPPSSATASLVALASPAPNAVVEKNYPTIDEILAQAKKGYTLQSYNAYIATNDGVDTSCFPEKLRTILSRVHEKFGTKPSVNSGFRTVSYNRHVGGVRGSYHIKCEAADIQVEGVSSWTLAKFLRAMPDVGGVGLYGCKNIVHVDVGPRRDWYYACRRRGRDA